MNTQPQLIYIRVDDIPLLLGLLLQMKIAEIYNREVSDYKTHTGLSGGGMLTKSALKSTGRRAWAGAGAVEPTAQPVRSSPAAT